MHEVSLNQWAFNQLILRNAAWLMCLEPRDVHIARDGSLGTNRKAKLVAFTEKLPENCPSLEQLFVDPVTLGG